MINSLFTFTDLTGQEFLILTGIVVVAGIVRGFSGFALSALVMASGVMILSPVELIPICWCLEMVASALMARSGWQEADRGVVMGLVIGSAVGVPIGLALLMSFPVETSKLVVLAIIIVLALTQLAKIRFAFLATRAGLYLSGFVAGVVTGLAHVGGMVVALYVLSQNATAAKMRAALVLYLFISMFTSLIFYLIADVMTWQALVRGVAFAVPAAGGVLIGQWLFIPRFAAYYRPFCLSLLCALAMISAIRTQFA